VEECSACQARKHLDSLHHHERTVPASRRKRPVLVALETGLALHRVPGRPGQMAPSSPALWPRSGTSWQFRLTDRVRVAGEGWDSLGDWKSPIQRSLPALALNGGVSLASRSRQRVKRRSLPWRRSPLRFR
jgi:hypothetical protein